MVNKRFKVLVSAYSCAPGLGSEPDSGWNLVKQLSRFNDTWILTRSIGRRGIENTLINEPMSNAHWIYCDLPKWLRIVLNGHFGSGLQYFIWQAWIYFVCKNLCKKLKFDLVHHVTYVTYWAPGFLAMLPIPFVLGPAGGGDPIPPALFKNVNFRTKNHDFWRSVTRWITTHFIFTKIIFKKMSLAFAITCSAKDKLSRLGCKDVRIISGVGLTNDELKYLESLPTPRDLPFRIISIGSLFHFKYHLLGISVFDKFIKKFPDAEYWIIGNGPEEKRLKNLAKKFCLQNKVKFFGRVPRNVVFEKLSQCHVLLHPSLHEGGSWVCVEAMAAKKPVICLDWSGPLMLVTEKTGFKIAPSSYGQVISDMTKAVLKLATDRDLLKRMGVASHKRVIEYYVWDKIGEKIQAAYEEVLSK